MADTGRPFVEETLPSGRSAESALPDLGPRYRINLELGRGGMGRVFSGRDLKLDREVAIKVLAPGVHHEEELLRFEQEARAAGSLNHANVLAVRARQAGTSTVRAESARVQCRWHVQGGSAANPPKARARAAE